MSALSGFNNVLIKFIDKVSKWYPELKDLQTIKTGIETFKKYNPRLVLDQFMTFVGPYYVQIFNKDENFFTNLKNLEDDPHLQSIQEYNQEYTQESIMNKLGVFKDVWGGMEEDRKKYVWKMFGALLKVGALASNDQEYKVIIKYIESNPQLFVEVK